MLLAVAALSSACAVAAADLPADVLARNRWMDLTRADYEKALARVPENLREEFATSPRRVQDVLNNLLVEKTLAAQARAEGARPPPFSAAADPDPQRALAAAEFQRIESDAGKASAARSPAPGWPRCRWRAGPAWRNGTTATTSWSRTCRPRSRTRSGPASPRRSGSLRAGSGSSRPTSAAGSG